MEQTDRGLTVTGRLPTGGSEEEGEHEDELDELAFDPLEDEVLSWDPRVHDDIEDSVLREVERHERLLAAWNLRAQRKEKAEHEDEKDSNDAAPESASAKDRHDAAEKASFERMRTRQLRLKQRAGRLEQFYTRVNILKALQAKLTLIKRKRTIDALTAP